MALWGAQYGEAFYWKANCMHLHVLGAVVSPSKPLVFTASSSMLFKSHGRNSLLRQSLTTQTPPSRPTTQCLHSKSQRDPSIQASFALGQTTSNRRCATCFGEIIGSDSTLYKFQYSGQMFTSKMHCTSRNSPKARKKNLSACLKQRIKGDRKWHPGCLRLQCGP